MKISIHVNPLALMALGCALFIPAQAAQILLNPGFESGFTSWQRADQLGGDGTFFIQTGTVSPINGDTVPAPPGGTKAAMSDGAGPGSHVLWQDFTIATQAAQVLVNFNLFVGNRAGNFASPGNLDFSLNAANQQIRVDILKSTAGTFSVSATDVLATIFQTTTASPLVSGYTNISFNLTQIVNAAPGTFRIRFAEVDNLLQMQAGVDNVTIDVTPTPEPSSLLLTAGFLLSVLTLRRKQ